MAGTTDVVIPDGHTGDSGRFPIDSSRIKINRQSGTDNFYVTWSLSNTQKKKRITKKVYNAKKKKTEPEWKYYPKVIDSYTIKWYYGVTKNGTWFLDKTIKGVKTTNTKADLWSPPNNAIKLKVTVQPIAKKYKSSSSKSSPWFTATATSKTDSDYDEYPSAPSISEFSIVDKALKAVVSVDLKSVDRKEATKVRLWVLKDSKSYIKSGSNYYFEKSYDKKKGSTVPSSGYIPFDVTLPSVGSYQVRAMVGVFDSKWIWSEYSEWSSSTDTRPDSPKLKEVKAVASDKVRVVWSAVSNVTKYEIEYVGLSASSKNQNDYFNSSLLQTVSVEGVTSYIISGLEAGQTYLFRVRSVNDADKSSPSNVLSVVLATKPAAPTTWSSRTVTSVTSTIDTTDPVYLYWIHNSSDGSAQQTASLEFTIGGSTYHYTKQNTSKDDYGALLNETTTLELWSLDVSEVIFEPNIDGDLPAVGALPTRTIYELFRESNATSIKWMVKTKGLHAEYSDWSIQRTIEAYEQPNLSLSIKDSSGTDLNGNYLTSFPIYLSGVVTPSSQTPISFHVSIVAGSTYDTTDIYGDDMVVSEGSEVYSKYFDEETLDCVISASDVDFVSDVEYTINVIVYTNVGLNAESSCTLTPNWSEVGAYPEALISYSETYRYATIRPSCSYFIGYDPADDTTYDTEVYIGTSITGTSTSNNVFQYSGITSASTGDLYFNTSTGNTYLCTSGGSASTATWMYRTTFPLNDVGTWYSGSRMNVESDVSTYPNSYISSAVINDHYINTSTGDIFKCIKGGSAAVAIWQYLGNCYWAITPNLTLSVYRKEMNGSYVSIAEGIDNTLQNTDEAIIVRDPHPSFNNCTYRIVSTNIENGAVGYSDYVENFPESSVVIQWDENWSDEMPDEENEVFDGSILELPANIKLSDKNSKDVTLVEYIGRYRPVSYYGTQRGENLTINCEFPKSDTNTLSALRRLMIYQGDVYIREPSGLGYWANVDISYNKDYLGLTIPVSITVRPVEGGA